MHGCIVCARASPKGALCADCRDVILTQPQLVPEQMWSAITAPVDAVVVDPWGRTHALGPRTMVGRQPGQETLAICDSSVSRSHAVVECSPERGVFSVRDLGSTNGTFLAGRRIEGPTELTSGDAIYFGHVGVFFLAPIPVRRPLPSYVDSRTVRKSSALARPEREEGRITQVGIPTMRLRVVEPSGGGGGFLEAEGRQCQLTSIQLDLMRLLIQRMTAERGEPGLVCGFVRSSELIASLGWETPHPNDNHVKQLIRRTRRTLERAGLGDLIESRHRLGYRLRVVPE
jgi:pSer/pThr/pTyr-binding forkhead associated (FHA) protein